MINPLVITTGRNGQLGWELEQLSAGMEGFDFLFTGHADLDLSDPESIPAFFDKHKPSYFIHCAAYTAVDRAESERELAYTINATATGIIAAQCSLHDCKLITISTDYVFDGNGTSPYLPGDAVDPVNYYGKTKSVGEQLALEANHKTVIIRTSWVYSTHGANFVKTMIRLMKERSEIKVVSDQVGCPTYARDLAAAILSIVTQMQNGKEHYGIYHYSNTGVISWYDFATAIRDEAALDCKVLPITSAEYPTPAKRPSYSVMNTDAIASDYSVELLNWRDSLKDCISHLK